MSFDCIVLELQGLFFILLSFSWAFFFFVLGSSASSRGAFTLGGVYGLPADASSWETIHTESSLDDPPIGGCFLEWFLSALPFSSHWLRPQWVGLAGGAWNWGADECLYFLSSTSFVIFYIQYIWNMLEKKSSLKVWILWVTPWCSGLALLSHLTAGRLEDSWDWLQHPLRPWVLDRKWQWIDGWVDGWMKHLQMCVCLSCFSALSDVWEVHHSIKAAGVARPTRFHLRLCGVTQLQFT